MIKRFKHIFFFLAILFVNFANLKSDGGVQVSGDSGNLGKDSSSMPGFDKNYDDDDYFGEPSPDDITPDFMQDQLKGLIYNPDGTDNLEGQNQLIEQYKMIAEISGESDPEAFAKKMLEETKGIVNSEQGLKEFGQTASSMVQSELGSANKKEKASAKKADDLMPSDEFKKRIYADDIKQEESTEFKKEEKKYEKKYKDDCQNWQKKILENNLDKNRGKFVYRSALNCLKQQWLNIQDSLNKNISVKDEEKISILKNQMDNFIQNMEIMNKSFYLQVLYKPEFQSLRASIVDMSNKMSEMFSLIDEFEDDADDSFAERGESEKDFFVSLDKDLELNFLSKVEIDDFKNFVTQASSKLDTFIFGKAITEAIAKKKKLMLLSESMVKQKNDNTYQNYNNNLNNNYSNYPGSYGSPYREFNRPISDYGRYNDWDNDRGSSGFDDLPKSSDSSTSSLKQKKIKNDDFGSFIKKPGIILLKEISQIKMINYDNLKKLTQGYFEIDPSYISSQIEEYAKKIKKNQDENSSKDAEELEAEGKENKNLKVKLKKFLTEVKPGLELLVEHPSQIIMPHKDDHNKRGKIQIIPFVKHFDQNSQAKFDQLKEHFSISALNSFVGSLSEVSPEISKKQQEFKKILNFATEESELKEVGKKTTEKTSSFRDKIFQAKKDLEKSCLQKIDVKLNEFSKFENQSLEDKDLSKIFKLLEELVLGSVELYYDFPLLGISEIPVEVQSKFLELTNISRKKTKKLVVEQLSNLNHYKGKNEFFKYIVSNFQDALEEVGFLENEKIKIESEYKKFARGINILNQIWHVDLTHRSFEENYSNWEDFFSDVLNYADVEFKKKVFEKLDKNKRKEMWLNTDLKTKAYMPDFIVFWCMGLEDQVDHDALEVERGFADAIDKKDVTSNFYVQALELDEIKHKLFEAFSEKIKAEFNLSEDSNVREDEGEGGDNSEDIFKRLGQSKDFEMSFQASLIPMIKELRKSFHHYISKSDYYENIDFADLNLQKTKNNPLFRVNNSKNQVLNQLKLLNLVNFILFVKHSSDADDLKLKQGKISWAIKTIKNHYYQYTKIKSFKSDSSNLKSRKDCDIFNVLRWYLFLSNDLGSVDGKALNKVFSEIYDALESKFVNIVPALVSIDKLSSIFETEKINLNSSLSWDKLQKQINNNNFDIFSRLKSEIVKLKDENNKNLANEIIEKLEKLEKMGLYNLLKVSNQGQDDGVSDGDEEGHNWEGLVFGASLLAGGLIAAHYSGALGWLKDKVESWWSSSSNSKEEPENNSNAASSSGGRSSVVPPDGASPTA